MFNHSLLYKLCKLRESSDQIILRAHEIVTFPHCTKITAALGGHFLEVNEI